MVILKKLRENLPIIIIAIAMLLLLVDYLNSKQIDFHIDIIVITLFLIASCIDLYRDIKNRQYSTATLIIVAGVIEIVAIIALCYFNFKSIDKANIDLLWERNKNIRISGLIMILMPSMKSILKSKRFEKKVNS